jgi:hypothetical protein
MKSQIGVRLSDEESRRLELIREAMSLTLGFEVTVSQVFRRMINVTYKRINDEIRADEVSCGEEKSNFNSLSS